MLCRIGEVEVWRVLESVAPFSPVELFFPKLTAEDLERHRHMAEPGGLKFDRPTQTWWVVLPIQAFLLRTRQHLVLVDACVGNDKTLPNMPLWHQQRSDRFMASLAAAGATPEDVTHVMCTHLHVDHVGWTTTLRDGRWVPTFPNAKVLATEADLEHARMSAGRRPDGVPGHIWAESILPLLDEQRFETVPGDYQLGDHIRLRPTPGHTPGHVSVEILAKGHSGAAITGDMMHSPLQCAIPELSSSVDFNQALAAVTRRKFLTEVAEADQLVLASHFPLPSVGRVVPEGDGFDWKLLG